MKTDQWLAQYQNKVDGIKQVAADLRENIAAATVTTTSPDESVIVTIGPNGSLRDLRFGQRASEHSVTELAALVMKTVARGQRAVSEKVVEAFAPMGSGTSAMELLTSFVPEEDPEDQVPANRYDELVEDTTPEVPQPPQPQTSIPAQPVTMAPPGSGRWPGPSSRTTKSSRRSRGREAARFPRWGRPSGRARRTQSGQPGGPVSGRWHRQLQLVGQR